MVRTITYLLILLLSGCTGNLRYAGEDAPRYGEQSRVYVVNPELQKEFRILENSGLYHIVHDHTAPIHIRLQTMAANLFCGNPIVSSAFTLGLVPVTLPDTYRFSYEEMKGGHSIIHSYELNMLFTYSLYERLRVFEDDDKELGKALRAAVNIGDAARP